MSTRQKDKTPVERMTNQTKFNLDDEWVTPEFLEEKFGKSKSYWYDLRRDELGPEFLSLGHRSILYRLASVEEWLKTLVVKSLSDPKYREMREMRRLKRQERVQRQQAKTEKRSLAPKTPKPDRNAPLLSWADVRLQRLRKPRFLLTQGERGERGLLSAGEVARRIADQLDVRGMLDLGSKAHFTMPVTAAPSPRGA